MKISKGHEESLKSFAQGCAYVQTCAVDPGPGFQVEEMIELSDLCCRPPPWLPSGRDTRSEIDWCLGEQGEAVGIQETEVPPWKRSRWGGQRATGRMITDPGGVMDTGRGEGQVQ